MNPEERARFEAQVASAQKDSEQLREQNKKLSEERRKFKQLKALHDATGVGGKVGGKRRGKKKKQAKEFAQVHSTDVVDSAAVLEAALGGEKL